MRPYILGPDDLGKFVTIRFETHLIAGEPEAVKGTLREVRYTLLEGQGELVATPKVATHVVLQVGRQDFIVDLGEIWVDEVLVDGESRGDPNP